MACGAVTLLTAGLAYRLGRNLWFGSLPGPGAVHAPAVAVLLYLIRPYYWPAFAVLGLPLWWLLSGRFPL